MTVKIDQKILSSSVKKEEKEFSKQLMGSHIERPEQLIGSTTKIKTPNTEHAVYVTINDILLNEGTNYAQRYPYEIFIQSKDVSHLQWMTVLTLTISTIFKSGDKFEIEKLIKNMKETHDPKAGYLKKGVFIPSLVADIGYVIERHVNEVNNA